MGPYRPDDSLPQVPSQMSFAERGQVPMSNGLRARVEGIDLGNKALGADFNTYLTGNPGVARWIAPISLGAQVVQGANPTAALKETSFSLAPPVLAGLAAKKVFPALSPTGIMTSLRSGAGAGLALKGNEYLQRYVGLEQPTDLTGRMNESPWRVGARAASNIVAGGAGGLAASKNPIGAIGGAVAGAMEEPGKILKTVNDADVAAQKLEWGADEGLYRRITDPRVPLDRVGNFNHLPEKYRDEALRIRMENAASGNFDGAKVIPRSKRTPGGPEFEAYPEGGRPSELAAKELLASRFSKSPTAMKILARQNIMPHLALGGGILAGGLGLYGLRKLFGKKEDEDKEKVRGYDAPFISTPDRWITS